MMLRRWLGLSLTLYPLKLSLFCALGASKEVSEVNSAAATHVLPLIPHHIHRQRLLKEADGDLDADQIAALYHGYGTHYVDLWCGTPPQRQTVIVDTGSGETAFPCSGCHDCGSPKYHIDNYFIEADSSTFREIHCNECDGICKTSQNQCWISMSYQEGSSWHAYEAIDNCYVGGPHTTALLKDNGGTDDLDPNHASAFSTPLRFGCQTSLTGLFKTQLADGIMGMEESDNAYWKQLYNGGKIEKQQFALCFSRPVEASRDGTVAGAMTLGGVDPRLDDTPLVYTPGAFEVNVRAIYLRDGVGGESAKYSPNADTISIDVPTGSFFVDSGTTDTKVNSKISSSFRRAFSALTKKTYDHTGMSMTPEEVSKLPTILFQLVGDKFQNSGLPADTVGLAGELDADHPLDVILALPPSHYMELDSKGKYTARFYDDGGDSVFGANALLGHNVFFDVEGDRIGWAESSCDYSELLAANGYSDILSSGEVEEASETVEEQEESDKKTKPDSSSEDDQASPPEETTTQALSDLASACDSLGCRTGAAATLAILSMCCVCLLRCYCCSKKYAKPSSSRYAELEMNAFSTSYRDADGFKDEPDGDDDEYGGFNRNPI